MTNHHHVEQAGYCPNCEAKLDGASGIDDYRPMPGDITVCVYCGTLSRFGPHMTIERLTEHDERVLAAEEPRVFGQIQRMQAFILARIRARAGGRA